MDSALIFGLSPLAWQAFGLCISIPGQILNDRCLTTFEANLLAARSASPLINAAVAYDFLHGVVVRHVKFPGPAADTVRLRRAVKLKLAREHPALLKGWLLRELQKTNPGSFFADLKARPGVWIEPLRELVKDLDADTPLREKADALLGALEGQSVFTTVAQNSRTRWAWTCELTLTNARAFFRAKKDWAKE